MASPSIRQGGPRSSARRLRFNDGPLDPQRYGQAKQRWRVVNARRQVGPRDFFTESAYVCLHAPVSAKILLASAPVMVEPMLQPSLSLLFAPHRPCTIWGDARFGISLPRHTGARTTFFLWCLAPPLSVGPTIKIKKIQNQPDPSHSRTDHSLPLSNARLTLSLLHAATLSVDSTRSSHPLLHRGVLLLPLHLLYHFLSMDWLVAPWIDATAKP